MHGFEFLVELLIERYILDKPCACMFRVSGYDDLQSL